jgi:hypothetical protein
LSTSHTAVALGISGLVSAAMIFSNDTFILRVEALSPAPPLARLILSRNGAVVTGAGTERKDNLDRRLKIV